MQLLLNQCNCYATFIRSYPRVNGSNLAGKYPIQFSVTVAAHDLQGEFIAVHLTDNLLALLL